jgi:hypothetical protein
VQEIINSYLPDGMEGKTKLPSSLVVAETMVLLRNKVADGTGLRASRSITLPSNVCA